MIHQNLRYAIRALASQPGFAAVAVNSLALGIGANTAIFSLLNSVLMSALPVRDPQALIILTNPGSSGDWVCRRCSGRTFSAGDDHDGALRRDQL